MIEMVFSNKTSGLVRVEFHEKFPAFTTKLLFDTWFQMADFSTLALRIAAFDNFLSATGLQEDPMKMQK